MGDQRYILKPLTNEDGKRGYRLEIDEFLADNEMTNLFLVALAELQKNSLKQFNGKPDWLTYYSLAGIHGQPQEKWNGYDPDQDYGFCHHSENTFPTWHRPYMMLYESAIHQEMVNQAQAYPTDSQRQTYLNAAARFRLPYWDLIMPRNEPSTPTGGTKPDPQSIWGCPEILKAANVFVKLPKDDPKKDAKGFSTISNPLRSFTFPSDWNQHPERIKLSLPNSYNQNHTVRVPIKGSNNESDDSVVDLVIRRQAAAAAVLVWQMLNPDAKGKALDSSSVEILVNEERSWQSFANDSFREDNIAGHQFSTVSLESFHDGIHTLLGTGWGMDKDQTSQLRIDPRQQSNYTGHMGNPAFAAFDPIFWLHHNNIERMLCLFQALYPSKYVSSNESSQQLYPFMTGTGRDCYKSSDPLVKNYWGSGFAIPGDKQLDNAVVKQKVKEYLTKTYYWATNATIVPGSLPNWPKKLKGSQALYGSAAQVVAAPVLQMNALTIVNGTTELVAREVPLHVKAPAIKEKVIQKSEVLKLALASDSSLPKGALTGPASITKPPVEITWNAHIKVRKFAFDGPFSIHVFVGYVKDDQPMRYMTKKNEVGFMGVFARSRDNRCATCTKNQEDDILVEDVVPLTTLLYDYLDDREGSENLIRDGEMKTIPSLEPQYVEPFLKEHLHWRIIDLGAELLVGQEQQSRLEITVTSRQFLPPAENNVMGVYGPYTPYPDITNNKPGGFGYTYPDVVTQ